MSLPWGWIVSAAVYGAAVGALLPRAVYRLAVEPEQPWRTACPAGHPLGSGVRGLLGAARCPRCATTGRTGPDDVHEGAPATGPQGAYGSGRVVPVVVGALVCAGLTAAVGTRPELVVWLLATPVALLLTEVDRRVQRLPDLLTLPLAAGVVLLLGPAALLPGAAGSWPRALLGGLVLAGAFFVLFLISPRGMGFGDVKLALTLGVVLGWYGWGVLFAGAFLGFLSGSLYGVALMATRRAGRGTAMAFGPFMVLGALGGVLVAAPAA
ncbi:prepilin peptidase [Streptomyces sp. NHF165]|nr:prepilin peptidase [Streptomyces sp. NHF165]